MRPLKLEFEGFTVYKKPQVIDFEKLNFFIIQGKTGAGKTSIVDAITYALYGKVPRYGKSRSATSFVLSRGSRKLRVSLEFSVGGRRYRIERFYREKPREDMVRVEEEGRRLDLRKTEVEDWIKKITGLDYETFTKVILLPQGEFDRLLKPSSPKERRDILIGLLNLEVFDRVRDLASSACRSLEGELNALRAELGSLSDLTEGSIEELERQREELEKSAGKLREEVSELEGRLRRAKEREELLRELKESERKLEELESRSEEFDRLREKVLTAKRVLPFLPYMDRLEELGRVLRDLRLERERVLKGKIKVEEELKNIESEKERLEREYSRIKELREELQSVIAEKERLSLVKEELTSVKELTKTLEEKTSLLKDKREILRDREEKLKVGETYIEETERELRELDFNEEDYERLLREVERKQSLLEERRRLEEVEEELKELEEIREEKIRELEDLRRELEREEERLQRESVKLYAHHIRSHLHEGDTCPVCGGEFRGSFTSEEEADLESLKENVDRLREELLNAEKELSSLSARIEALAKERDNLTRKLKGWESILSIDIESRLRELEEKKRKKRELEDRLRKFTERYNQRLKERESALREVERLESEIGSLRGNLEEKERRIIELFGSLPTGEDIGRKLSDLSLKEKDIRSRIEEVERKREEVKSYSEELVRKLIALDTKLREIEEAIESREREKRESSRKLTPLFEEFGDLESVRGLAMSQEEVSALEREIEGYFKERDILRSRIEELEERLSGFGDTPSVEEVENELEVKKGELEEVLRRIGELKSTLEQKRELLEKKRQIEKRISEIEGELHLYSRISEDLKSNRLQDFVASLMLKRIVERASEYLYNFTNTYELEMDEKGDLVVIDRVQGTERSVRSLSGGETFLASLSLALGVSDVLSADAHLESLFIDEGFGSLDEETRERVSDILEVIKQRINRMVGIISHVPDLAERFHQRIVVNKQGDFSTVEVFY